MALNYTSVVELRSLDGMDDETVYTDQILEQAGEWAETIIDDYTGTSWTYKEFTSTLDGAGYDELHLVSDNGRSILFPRSITSCTIDDDIVDTTGWHLRPEGYVIHPNGWFATGWGNIVITGTAGATATPPVDIAWAARTLARQYAVDLFSRIPDRALQLQSDFGMVHLAQAGAPGRPTSLPDVNAVLNRRKHRYPALS